MSSYYLPSLYESSDNIEDIYELSVSYESKEDGKSDTSDYTFPSDGIESKYWFKEDNLIELFNSFLCFYRHFIFEFPDICIEL